MKSIFYVGLFTVLFTGEPTLAQTYFPTYSVASGDVGGHSVAGPLVSPASGSVNITASTAIIYKSGKSVSLEPGFKATPSGTGTFDARIDFQVAVIEATATSPTIQVGIYEKLELGLLLPDAINNQVNSFLAGGTGINPYDPAQISIEATFTPPSGGGSARTIYGFYYKEYNRSTTVTTSCPYGTWTEVSTPYHWRVRFAPNYVGTGWTASIKVVIPSSPTLQIDGISFDCITSSNRGPLVIASNNTYLKYKKTGDKFVAIGSNIPYPNVNFYPASHTCNAVNSLETAGPNQYMANLTLMQDLLSVNGNYVRVGIGPWNYAFEWDKLGNYDARQMHAWELDQVLKTAHNGGAANELYIQLFLEDGGKFKLNSEYGDPINYAWPGNPYKSSVNGNVISGINEPADFFDVTGHPDAATYYKKKLRYFMSRYGYSMNLTVMDVLSEMDAYGSQYDSSGNNISTNWYGNNSTMRANENTWLYNMIDYMQLTTTGNLGYSDVLYSTSFAGNPLSSADPFADSRIKTVSSHYYNDNRNIHFYRADLTAGWRATYNKPFIYGEMGVVSQEIQTCTDVEFHDNLWATVMAGSFGTGLNWSGWDQSNYPSQLTASLPALGSFINLAISGTNVFSSPVPKKFPASKDTPTLVECYSLTAGTEAIGWVHNRSNYWGNLNVFSNTPGASCYFHNRFVSSYLHDNEDDSLITAPASITCGSTDKITIDGFNPGTQLYVKWYTTRGTTSTYVSYTLSTVANSSGQITFAWPAMYDGVGADAPGDYAFIASTTAPRPGHASSGGYQQFSAGANLATGIDSLLAVSQTLDAEIFPNPNDGSFIVKVTSPYEGKNISITITDILGNTITSMQNVLLDQKLKYFSFDLSNQLKGIYLIKIIDDQGVHVKKIVKQ